ncbi:hypothetical protein GCM10027346_21170 [Hymenobacter seoulensis]
MKPYFIPLLSLLLTTGCKKEKTELERLPSATQEGKNTAGFLLDVKAWIPEWNSSYSTNSPVDASWKKTKVGRTLRLGFSRLNDRERLDMDFFIPDVQKAGTYSFNQQANLILGDLNPSYAMYVIQRPVPLRAFYTGPSATGTLIISRFDTMAHIVAGTFNLTVQEETSTETHQLTQGRFDLTF